MPWSSGQAGKSSGAQRTRAARPARDTAHFPAFQTVARPGPCPSDNVIFCSLPLALSAAGPGRASALGPPCPGLAFPALAGSANGQPPTHAHHFLFFETLVGRRDRGGHIALALEGARTHPQAQQPQGGREKHRGTVSEPEAVSPIPHFPFLETLVGRRDRGGHITLALEGARTHPQAQQPQAGREKQRGTVSEPEAVSPIPHFPFLETLVGRRDRGGHIALALERARTHPQPQRPQAGREKQRGTVSEPEAVSPTKTQAQPQTSRYNQRKECQKKATRKT